MQKKGNSRKSLIIGIVAAVVILAAVLALLLTQCVGFGTGTTTPTGTVETVEQEIPTYNLYWNADRAEYDGMSEAGLSSRMPEADGYFHIRFILDGEEIVLKTADRKIVNAIDVRTLMDLEFDENGIITGVIDILEMPVKRLGWMFYVQSAAKNLVKLNSSADMNGIEVLLELSENAAVYDMSGETGPLGIKAEAMNMDRVYALGNMAGEVTHVFIYDRPNFMLSHEAECQHCKKVVTWREWAKEDQMPTSSGHYQLQNDVQLSKQPRQEEDSTICIDLNGHRVDASSGVRCYAMYNAGTELAIMDTSEGQTGIMASHGVGAQGMVVWVRYGVFYLYGGTLDGSDSVGDNNGVTVATGRNTYFYMHGGTIIGGVAEPYQKDDGSWTAGLGGSLAVAGKFTMHDGEIRGGKAKAVITARNEDGSPMSYTRGMGGNIMMSSDSEMIMNGGLITGGYSGGNGGNIYMDSRASLTINGGTIRSGRASGNGRSGGNIYVGNKATLTMNGGVISGGTAYAVGGNIRSKGIFTMNGGYISGGTVRDWATGAKVENSPGANVRIQDGQMYMNGGQIKGGVSVVDSSNKDNIKASLRLNGRCVIDGGTENDRNLTLGAGGDGVQVRVGKLHKDSKVGVHATTGYFTLPTEEDNKNGVLFSDIEGAEVIYHDGKLALGALGCVCGKTDGHFGDCDGTIQLWIPWITTTSLPKSTGYWYLLSNLDELPKQTNVTNVEPQQVYLNLNGYSATVPTGTGRVYRVNGSNQLVITDHVGTGGLYSKGMSGDVGSVIFQQDKTSRVQLYGGTLAMTADCVTDTKSGGVIRTNGIFDMFGGTVSGGKAVEGGNILLYTGATMNMYGGTVQGGTAGNGTVSSHSNIYVYNATFNMSGGSVYGIRATNAVENGCSINISGSAKILLGKGGHAFRMTVAGNKLTTEQRPMINVGEMNDDGVITISGVGGYVTGVTDKSNTKYFASSVNEEIGYEDGRVYIGKRACVCGSKTDEHIGDCDGTKHHWSAWSKTDSLPTESGYWYLTQNLTINKQSSITNADAQQVYLNLNGFTVTSAVRVYRVSNSNLLAITDHKGGGGLYGGGLSNDNGGTILQQNNTSVIKMYGGTLGMGANALEDTVEGGILRTNGTFYLYAGTITGGKAAKGGNIHLHSGSVFYLDGGTVSGGTASDSGGNFSVSGGTLHILNGTVSDGTAANGGNIRIYSGTINLNEGVVSDGVANAGGNIYLNTGSTMNMSGGKVQGGKGLDGTFSSHSNIYVYNATFNMSDGIAYGVRATNSVENGCNINISGSARILLGKGGHAFRMTVTGDALTAEQRPMINLGEMNDDAKIIISGVAGYITTVTDEGNAKYFASSANEEVNYTDSRVYIGKRACVCGSKTDEHIGDCDGTMHHWSAWSKTDSLPAESGYWYLTQNLTINKQSSITNADAQQVYLNLNGFTVTSAVRVYRVSNSNLLAITDHKGGGGLYGGGLSNDNGGTILQQNNTSVIKMYGGTLGMGANAVEDTVEGGILRTNGTFYLYAGTITGGKAAEGGNIHLHSGSVFHLDGGTVSGGAAAESGGNFNISNGTLYILDGIVSDGSAANGGNIHSNGTIEMFKGTVTKGVASVDGGNIYVNEDSVKCDITGGTITDGTATGSGGNLRVHKAKVSINGITVSGGAAAMGNNIYQAGSASAVTLTDVTVDNTVTGSDNAYVRAGALNIEGTTELKTVSGSRNINTSDEGSGIINLKSGTVTGAEFDGDGANIWLSARATLNVTNGTITGGTATGNGGNVYLSAEGAKVTMTSGTITGGCAVNGGNISQNGGTFSFNGGTISDGTASASGGNVHVVTGTFQAAPENDSTSTRTISGGVAGSADSTEIAQGGNIYADRNAVILLTGEDTLVSGGTAISTEWHPGGNIRVDGTGDFQITGGAKVTGGTADEGNNIYISRAASNVTLDGAVIENTASSGSNIHAKAGKLNIANTTMTTVDGVRNIMTQDDGNVTITISGTSTVTGAKVSDDGANIWISKVATLNVTGGTITGGNADGKNGGNIYSAGGPVNISGGTISGGKAGQGGNIALNETAESSISGGTIKDGQANYGGNVSVVKGVLTASSGTITGGTASTAGNNLYISGSVSQVTLSGVDLVNTVSDKENLLFRDGTLTLSGGSLTTVDGSRNINAENKGLIKVQGATITGEKFTGDGANIFLTGTAKLQVSSGSIVGGEASGKGGNIYTESTEEISISGGTIADGKAKTGGNIMVAAGTLRIAGATVTGGSSTEGGGNIYSNATVLMSSGSVTGGQAGTDGGNIYANEYGVKCEITGGTISGGTATGNGGNLRAHKAQLTVSNATVSGGTATSGNNIYAAGAASNVVLTNSTIDNTVGSGANIHMRAGTLTVSGSTEIKTVAGSRNICTDKETKATINVQSGTVKGAKTNADGANIWISDMAVLNVSGGTISGGNADGKNGGNIFTDGGSVTISGGVVTGGSAASGGNVYVAAGTLKVSDTATVKDAGNGNNIMLADSTALELSGGSVAGGIKLGSGVSVKISGAPTVDPELTGTGTKPAFGIDLTSGTGNTVANVAGMTGGKIVVMGNLGKFAANATADMVTYFQYVDDTLVVEHADGALNLVVPVVIPEFAACVCATDTDKHVSYTIDGVTYGCVGTELEWTDFTPTAQKPLPTDAGNYRLTGDTTVSAEISLSAAVVLDLNGYTITVESGRMYTLASGASLTITNNNPDEGGIVVAAAEGKTVMAGAVAEIASGTTLDIYNTKISMAEGTSVTGSGGLFLVHGTMNIFGETEIAGGTVDAAGGNIYVATSAVLNMYDGVVTKGKGVSGGNIGTESGTLNLYGGTVTEGQATNGGNIWNSKATLNARATTISGGSCTGHGNNIYTTGSASGVYLTGTKVYNTVSNNEDNITYRAGKFEIKNATLTSVDDDYNIFSEITNGNKAIVLNNVTFAGGGIYLTADKTIAIAGAMPSGSSIAVKYDVAVTDPVAFATGSGYTIPYAAKSWFTSADGYPIGLLDGKLQLMPAGTHIHCVCGGTLRDGQTFADGTSHTCKDIIYQELTSDADNNNVALSVLNAQDVNNWYLGENVQMEDNSQGSNGGKELNLCLNGHSFGNATNSRRMFNIDAGKLFVTTCKSGATGATANKLISTGDRAHNGSIILATGTVEVETYGVTLDGSGFTLTGTVNGGTVSFNGGSMKMYNTTIIGNQMTTSGDGSAVLVASNKNFYMYGGSIIAPDGLDAKYSTVVLNGGAKLHLIGDATVTTSTNKISINVSDNASVNVSSMSKPSAAISVSASGVFTTGWNSENTIADYFVSALVDKAVALNTGSGELELVDTP